MTRDADGQSHLMMQTGWPAHEAELPLKIGDLGGLARNKTGNALYLTIANANRGELLKFDVKQTAPQSFLPGLSADYVYFSRDRQWMTYTGTLDHSLWRSRVDGSEAVQLTKAPMEVQVSSWSPDGRRIAFMGKPLGKPFRIYLVNRDGGQAEEASAGNDNQGGPSWSPDGKFIAYANVFCHEMQDCWMRRIDLASHKAEIVPGSQGFRTARWSPNGKYVAALQSQTHELMLFNVSTQRWRSLADSVTGDNINWSSDSQYVYVDSPKDKKPVVERVRIRDGKRITVVSLATVEKGTGALSSWIGLTPDNSTILVHMYTASEIYALNWTGH